MSFFQALKEKRILKEINKSETKRQKSFKYIEENQKIGILINGDNPELKYSTENFLKEIRKNNSLSELVFVNKKIKKGEVLPENTVSIYSNNFHNSDALTKFLAKQYDILIMVSSDEVIEGHYILAKTKAELKVSPSFEKYNFADLTFILKKEYQSQDYFDAIKQYLFKN